MADDGKDLFPLGVCLNLMGSCMINTGQTLVKKAHKIPEDDPSKKRWQRIAWAIFALGNIGNFTSMSFAPQSTLAALGSIQFVVAPFNAHFWLHEEVLRVFWFFQNIRLECGI